MKPLQLNHRIGRTLEVEGRKLLYFSGTSYLGMESLSVYEEILIENIRKWGFNHGLSRVNNLRLSLFEEFEQFFATHSGAESAAVMSSGYLAGQAALQRLRVQTNLCWIAPDTHPAILPESLKPDIQFSFIQWKNRCLELAESLSAQKILILGNAVDPLRAEVHDYSWVKYISKKHEVTLLIDDSHAFGTLGHQVFGSYSSLADSSFDLVVSGSLGKGLAMPAGIILGKQDLISSIKAREIFAGASPGSPANLQAFLDCQDLYQAQAEKIRHYSQIFHQETNLLSSVLGSEKFPVFVLSENGWAERLGQMGFLISSFAYPTPQSPTINRIVVSAFHTFGDLMAINDALHQLSEDR
ncbi:aminotransferase class I/II-fold pyridoxal phosphate-dependent enzyme [Algoriphagus sanaruensis]|uniref:Aminotransferase class I/classII large domain-containing protein n=1 Tax=Algoriphagus sanaruensis TaxID=1727163 RepID=A0A142EJE2_9BACT|nr:aminotransferase class I/II-fold pyridoxal phosphate-dependent enzyme [Algoriphagus sanaruensis]AMQ55247.1 hypothetical protein AO498_02475 [Algoriphagus sanaruensis]